MRLVCYINCSKALQATGSRIYGMDELEKSTSVSLGLPKTVFQVGIFKILTHTTAEGDSL